MAKRIRRDDDCKTVVESALRSLSYDTNPSDANQLHDKECVVLYGDVDISVYSQQEYEYKIYITIEFGIANNNEIPYTIMEMVQNITDIVEESGVAWCTSFQFSNCSVSKPGSVHVVTLTAFYEPVKDWVTP
jgi:hypothetical protein